MSFSGAVQLTDLNDFINPSLECIQPIQVERVKRTGRAEIVIKEDGSYNEVNETGETVRLQPAKITLNDCLACSGCVTTAEEILVTEQSFIKLQLILDANAATSTGNEPATADDQPAKVVEKVVVVVSMSSEALSSLAVEYSLSLQDVALKVCRFFKQIGVDYVIDESYGHRLSLERNAREFLQRYRRIRGGAAAAAGGGGEAAGGGGDDETKLPMLSSACPGWICYAEKTHGSHILPYIATTKSGQQILGSLVKQRLYNNVEGGGRKIYHVSLMACFDKKLEASRPDFSDDDSNRDVDCVITSGELKQVLVDRDIDLRTLADHDVDTIPLEGEDKQIMAGFEGEGSGGFLEYVMRRAAKELFDITLDTIELRTLKNEDMREATVEVDGKPVLRFLRAHGFRNIQNVVQKLKRRMKFAYDFVEIMACPSGCLNGGGQIRAQGDESSKERLQKVRRLYNESVTGATPPSRCSSTHKEEESIYATTYRAVQANTNALAIRW